jgi:hypothetical protein
VIIDNLLLDENYRRIVEWISNCDFATPPNQVINERLPGTAEWLLESNELKNWIGGRTRTLWCPGIREIVLFLYISVLTNS